MRRAAHRRGAVTIEFLIAIVPVLLVLLGSVQLLLLGATRLVVSHAAVAAARSAAVVLDDDPAAYGGEPQGHLGRARDSASAPAPASTSPAQGTLAAIAMLTGTRSRLDVIRRAASAPLAALAPSPAQVARWFLGSVEGSVGEAVAGSPLVRALGGISVYDRAALAVHVDSEPDAAGAELVTVHVIYLAHCAIPLASALICRPLAALLESEPAAKRALGDVPAPDLTRALAATAARFVVLASNASFPRQRASYLGASSG